MNILLLGGTGFVGRRVAAILRERGNVVTAPRHHELDLLNVNQAQAKAFLHGQDAVFNCVGVMSRNTDILEQIHHHTPAKLVKWAHELGVKQWVQLSALGANATHEVAFVGSKGRGDTAVLASDLRVTVLRSSIIYGRGGASCELFLKLAKLPMLALPNGGRFDLQPVHVDDVAQGLVALLDAPHGTIVNSAGSLKMTLAEYLSAMRVGFHHKNPLKIINIPLGLITPFTPLSNILTNGVLSAASLKLLQEGSCADTQDFAQLLGREPRGVWDFFRQPE